MDFENAMDTTGADAMEYIHQVEDLICQSDELTEAKLQWERSKVVNKELNDKVQSLWKDVVGHNNECTELRLELAETKRAFNTAHTTYGVVYEQLIKFKNAYSRALNYVAEHHLTALPVNPDSTGEQVLSVLQSLKSKAEALDWLDSVYFNMWSFEEHDGEHVCLEVNKIRVVASCPLSAINQVKEQYEKTE